MNQNEGLSLQNIVRLLKSEVMCNPLLWLWLLECCHWRWCNFAAAFGLRLRLIFSRNLFLLLQNVKFGIVVFSLNFDSPIFSSNYIFVMQCFSDLLLLLFSHAAHAAASSVVSGAPYVQDKEIH